MDRKRLTIKYGSLVHFSCNDGYITASGLQEESLFIRGKEEVGMDAELLPLFGFETSVFRLEAPETSLVAKMQVVHDATSGGGEEMKDSVFNEHSRVNTAANITFGQAFLLVHSVSRMHVAAFPSKVSQWDPDCVKLVLVKPGEVASMFCEFTFASRYKIHEEGNPVCRGDEILLRLAAEPLFVHLTLRSTNTVGTSLSEFVSKGDDGAAVGVSEVNMSEESGVVLVVQRYDIGRDQANQQRSLQHIMRPYIPAGVPVAFYHREHECLLATSLTMPPPQQHHPATGEIRSGVDDGVSAVALGTGQHHSTARDIITSRGAKGAESGDDVPHNAQNDAVDDCDPNDVPIPLFVRDRKTSMNEIFSDEANVEDIRCSCTALWILENEDPTVGGPVRTRSLRYRLRQACSNRYLAVAGSAVDTFFDEGRYDDEGRGLPKFTDMVQWNKDQNDEDGDQCAVRATTLCMIPPPRSQKELQITLFTVIPTFASDCNFIMENECLLLQNVLTGMYVCTQEKGNRLSLQWQPPVYDTIVIRKAHSDIEDSVLLLWAHCERLRNYRDAFQMLGSPRAKRQQQQQQEEEEQQQQQQEGQRKKDKKRNRRRKQMEGHYGSTQGSSGDVPQESSTTVVHGDDDGLMCFIRPRDSHAEECLETLYASLLPIIRACQRTLAELILFCSASPERNVLRRDGIPILQHQRMMFDLCIHRLIVDVILSPFARFSTPPPPPPPPPPAPAAATGGGGGSGRVVEIRGWRNMQWACNPKLPPRPLNGGVIQINDILSTMHEEVHLVCRLAFRLLRQMIRKAPSLKTGFDEFIPYLLEFDGCQLHVLDSLTEVFSENPSIATPVLEHVVDHSITNLGRVRSAGYLQLLSSMCVMGNHGIPERQAIVCQKLLIESSEVLCHFVLNSEEKWAVATRTDEDPVPCHIFFNMEHQQNADAKLIHYAQSEVELLGSLCLDGCSSTCYTAVSKVFPPHVLLEAVHAFVWTGAEVAGQSSSLDMLRSHILRLALHCYIVPCINIPAVQLRVRTVLFGSSRLRIQAGIGTPLTGIPDEFIIRKVKQATHHIIRSNPYFVHSDVRRNVLLQTSLDVWLRLVSQRQISVFEMTHLIPPLLALLDGTKDVIEDSSSNMVMHTMTRLEISEAVMQVIRARELICKMLLQLVEIEVIRSADEVILFLYDTFFRGQTPSPPRPHSGWVNRLPFPPGANANAPPSEKDALLHKGGRACCDLFWFCRGNRHRCDRRGGYQSIETDAELVDMNCNPGDLIDTSGYLKCCCEGITQMFCVKELVPRLMDLVNYDNSKLTSQAMELLVRLCAVRRSVAYRVLQVHTLPSAEVMRNFDNLYAVVTNLYSLRQRGCIEEAVGLALSSIEGSEAQPEAIPATEAEEASLKDDGGVGGDDNAYTDEEEGDGVEVEEGHTAYSAAESGKVAKKVGVRHFWPKTSGAARILLYRNAIRKRRRLMGLREASRTPLFLIIRAEMACHWHMHDIMLQMCPRNEPTSSTFFKWMRFFYIFTLSQSNAMALRSNIDLFMQSLTLNPDCTAMCLHIILAILGTEADPTPYLTTTFLNECVRFLDHEVKVQHPEGEIASLLSANVFAKPAVGGVVRRHMLQLLRDHNTLQCLSQFKTQLLPEEGSFIASLVEMLCCICGYSVSALALGQLMLPKTNILSNIIEYGTAYSPIRLTSTGETGEMQVSFLLVGTYLLAIVSLYLSPVEVESGQSKMENKMEWMANHEWWAVVQLLTNQLSELTKLVVSNDGSVLNRGLLLVERYRKVWLMAVPIALLTFATECFLEAGFYRLRHFMGSIFYSMCETIMEFSTMLLSHSNALNLHVREVVMYRRLLAVLHIQTRNIVGLENLAGELECSRNLLRDWLIRHDKRVGEAKQQQSGHNVSGEVRPSDPSCGVPNACDTFFNDGMSQFLQENVFLSSSLLLSGAATNCREVDVARSALCSFIQHDVLIPLEDGADPADTSSVVTALLQQSTNKTSIRNFVSKVLVGLKRRSFSAMASVGLLNCLYNALQGALHEEEKKGWQRGGQEKEQWDGENMEISDGYSKVGGRDTGCALQQVFNDIGMLHVVSFLCAIDNEVLRYSATRLGVALLEGGNQKAQQILLDYFETHQEGFFENARDELRRTLRWVSQVNTEHQLAVLERGGIVVNVSNLQRFRSMVLASVFTSSSDSSSFSSQSCDSKGIADGSIIIKDNSKRGRLSGWGGMNGCLRLRFILSLFRMLQLCCEGHNLRMQHYIRAQHDSVHSVDILHEVMLLIAEIAAVVHPATVGVLHGGFELLMELCQGPCHANQVTLLNYDVCTTICRVLDQLDFSEATSASTTTSTTAAGVAVVDDDDDDTAVKGKAGHHIHRMNEKRKGNTSTDDISGNDNINAVNTYHGSDTAMQYHDALTQTDIGCLRLSLTRCLLSLIEGCRTPSIFHRVLAQIPVEVIERELSLVSPAMYNSILEDEQLENDPSVEALFNWLIFLHTVRPYAEGLYRQHIDVLLRRTAPLCRRLGFIEVRRADGLLENVFFRIPLISRGLTQRIKDDVLWGVNRTSRATKLGDFLHRSDNLIFEVEWVHTFQSWVSRWTSFRLDKDLSGRSYQRLLQLRLVKCLWNRLIAPFFFSVQLDICDYASIALSVIVNTGLIFFEGARWNSDIVRVWMGAITYICILQFVLSCNRLCADAVVFFPVCIYTEYRRKQHLSSGRAKFNATLQEAFHGMTIKEIFILFCTRFSIQLRTFFVVMAALSIFVSPYFAAAHLLLVIYKTPTLCTFTTAITQNGKQLLLTAFLGLVMLYLFTIVGYLFFPRGFGTQGETQDENCSTLLRCFAFILWKGLRQGGGVGDVMEEEPWTSNILIPRVSYDLLFFAFINVIFLNVMFGLIIDTFGELRDDKRRKEIDMTSTCFICGLDADTLEKSRLGGFYTHVNREHNMWMYLYFMHYLRRKNPNDFTGQESYVQEKIQQNDLAFFPEESCLSLQEGRDHMNTEDVFQDSAAHAADEGSTTGTGNGGGLPGVVAMSGLAEGRMSALPLKVAADVREALSSVLQEVASDAQRVKALIQELEIATRSVRCTSTSASPSDTQVTRGVLSQGHGPQDAGRK